MPITLLYHGKILIRARDRDRKLMKKISEALERLDSGDPIGLPRLLVRPVATLSIDAQTRRAIQQCQFAV